ncbi:MAG: hypothetical protein QOE93_1488 [Actinomycetota bacterium]|nr:hypothetical protein [Actinomycetota bacterium]
MAKPGARVKVRDGETSPARQRVVDAALETLKREGWAGTSARAVAATGGFAQGLVFYHFGTVADLLIAALDETARRRMDRYQAALAGVTTLPELLAVAGDVYREDLDSGHIKVLAELIAGSSSIPGLGAEIARRTEPWITLVEETVERVVADSPLAGLVPTKDLAFAVVALYLGVELLTHLDGSRDRADSLFAAAGGLGTLLGPLVSGA